MPNHIPVIEYKPILSWYNQKYNSNQFQKLYQNIQKIFPNQITYFHKSIHYKFYYYEENNGFIGVKYQNEDGGTHLLVDNEKEYFYNIIIDDADTEKIKIEKYKICDCP